MTDLAIPELALVCLIGASGSGKSTFAREHFGRFEVLSSDFCRGLVADDENDRPTEVGIHHRGPLAPCTPAPDARFSDRT